MFFVDPLPRVSGLPSECAAPEVEPRTQGADPPLDCDAIAMVPKIADRFERWENLGLIPDG